MGGDRQMTKIVRGITPVTLEYLIYLFETKIEPLDLRFRCTFYVNKSEVEVVATSGFRHPEFTYMPIMYVGNTQKSNPAKYLRGLRTAQFED